LTDHLTAVASAVREGLATRPSASRVNPADVPVEDVIALAEPFLAGAGGADLLELLLELHRPDASLGVGRVLCEHDLYAWPCPTADLCAAWARPGG
jgi:hypothetical protein